MIGQSVPRAKRRGVLLVGHGTRDQVGTEQFFSLASRLAARVSPMPVAPALLEFQQPTIAEAWDTLVERDLDHICVAPLLLFAAGHARTDIPEIVSACQARSPHVTVDQSHPISRHHSIVELVVERLEASLRELSTPAERTAVVMVGRGNRDPCAQADMRVLSEVVSRRIDASLTVTAFYAMADPKLPVVLEEIAASRKFDGVVVHPHLLFEGRLYQSILDQTRHASNTHSDMHWVSSPYLGPDARVAEAIAARIGQLD